MTLSVAKIVYRRLYKNKCVWLTDWRILTGKNLNIRGEILCEFFYNESHILAWKCTRTSDVGEPRLIEE